MQLKTPDFWRKTGFWAIVLYPLTWVYRALLAWDKQHKSRLSFKAEIPVISVGNITVGGGGKTPVVALLAEHFSAKGEVVAIISRGFGADLNESHLVTKTDNATSVGDEPKMLFDMFQEENSVQIWAGRNRVESLQNAQKSGATLAILDDGMQHWAVQRDVDIVVINGSFGLGNGLILPAGALREPVSAMQRADFALLVNAGLEMEAKLASLVEIISASRQPNSEAINSLKDKQIVAFCGLGLPEQFFLSLQNAEVNLVETVSFADHHNYNANDLKMLKTVAKNHDATLVTTPKDAVKLPPEFRQKCVVVSPEFTPASREKIINKVEQCLAKKYQK